MKKLFIFLILILTIGTLQANAYNLVGLTRDDGTPIYYRGTTIQAQIPDAYDLQDSDFRAVWITHFTGDIAAYSTEAQYKREMESVFEVMKYYNLNAMIFHVRTHNNALYKSQLNPRASWWANVNFDVFDPLEWIIEQCHIRGIEFHAWMNPYRVDATRYASPLPSVNPASDPNNVVSGILNPGEPVVRDFLVDTVMELIENYDIDAIHFDDYFYVKGINDQTTRNKYNTEGLSISNFRRKQVDLFIENLHRTMKAYNRANNRAVQLGISPSGIYRNGSYVDLKDYQYGSDGSLTYPLGSNTAGMEHYDDYLYADTKKWIDNEWIDYIIPQTYWAFDHSVARFADLMDWWSMVVKNKKVNLYSGMGLYMIDVDSSYSWKSTAGTEALKQVLYGTKHPEIKGHAIFSYKHLKYAYNKTGNTLYNTNFSKVKNEAWNSPAILPETRTYKSVILPQVDLLQITKSSSGQTLSFNNNQEAKFYVIYRSQGEITFSASEVIDVIGARKTDNVVSYSDNMVGDYNYGIKAMSTTNTLGDGAVILSDHIPITFKDYDGRILKIDYVLPNGVATPPADPVREHYVFTGWDQDYTNITEPLTVTAEYSLKLYKINFFDYDNQIIKTVQVSYLDNITPPEPPIKEGYYFIGWDKDFNSISSDLDIFPIYEGIEFLVKFFGTNGELLKEENVGYKQTAVAPKAPMIEGYKFIGWDKEFNQVTNDLEIYAQYEIIKYLVRFYGMNEELLQEVLVEYKQNASAPVAPAVEGYTFTGWDNSLERISNNLDIHALYKINKYSVRFLGINGQAFKEIIVEHNQAVIAPPAPKVNGYNFVGWDQSLERITDNLEVHAIYEILQYQVKFLGLNGELLEEVTVDHREDAIPPVAPKIEGYEFNGWDQSLERITDNLEVHAQYEKIKYSIRFIGIYGDVIEEQIIDYQQDATAPEAPKIEGYEFTGWDKEFMQVTEDLVVNAQYKKLNSSASCTKFNLQFSIFLLGITIYLVLRKRK